MLYVCNSRSSIWKGNPQVNLMSFSKSSTKNKGSNFALSCCASLQMHVHHTQIELLARKSDFLGCTLSFFLCKSVLASKTHLRSFGGLLGIMFDFILVLYLLLKGHVEAILAICSYECYASFFTHLWKVDFCDTSTVFLMILIIANFNRANHCHRFVIFSKVFMCFLSAPRNPWRPLSTPCLSQMALGAGTLIMILKYYNTTQLHFDYGKPMLPHALEPKGSANLSKNCKTMWKKYSAEA